MASNLHIAHLTSAHPRFDTRVFAKMCTSVVAKGWHCSLVVADGKGDAQKDGVHIYDIGKPANRFQRMVSATYHVYRKANHLKADIYHLHDPELLPVGYLLHLAGSKVIFDSHETVSLQIMDKHYLGWMRRPIAFMYKRLERFVCRRLTGTIGATPAISGYFKSQNITAETINNYPRKDEFSNDTVQFATDGWEKRNKLTFVGVMTKERGLAEAVEAMEKVSSQTRLTLIGKIVDAHLTPLIEQSDKTDFLGWKSHRELPEIFEQTIAGLVTFWPIQNHIDAQPNKLFEYMAAGLPVIASDFPLWRQIIGDAQCGLLVDPKDPTAIAKAVDYLQENPDEAARFGANGQKAVKEKYHWGSEEKKLLSYYQAMALASS